MAIAPFPLLQFQAYNPMDEMIRAGLSTYGTIDESRQRAAQRENMALQRQMMEAELPYIGQMKEADIARIRAQTIAAQQQAAMEGLKIKAFNQMYDRLYGGNKGNVSAQNPQIDIPTASGMQSYGAQGQQQPSIPRIGAAQSSALPIQNMNTSSQIDLMNNYYGGQPSNTPNTAMRTQQTGMYMGPSQEEQAFRALAGFPTVTAQEQYYMEMNKAQQQRMLERQFEAQYGTNTNLSAIQAQQRGIETLLPVLDDLINSDVPGVFLGYGSTPNARQAYDAKVNNALQKLIAAEGWKGNADDKAEGLQMLKRQDGETESNYKERLKFLRKQILDTNEVLEQTKRGQTSSGHGQTYTEDDIAYTAKKHGLTREQVIQRLNGGI